MTTHTPPSPITLAGHVLGRHLVGPAASGLGVALALAGITWLAARALGIEMVVAGPGGADQAVTLATVAGMTTAGGVVGWLMATAARRWTRRPRLAFVATCLVALTAYAWVPFQAATTTATAVWLNVLHLVVAIPVIGLLGRSLPSTRP